MTRVLIIAVFVAIGHGATTGVRWSLKRLKLPPSLRRPKLKSLSSLGASIIIFVLYFSALGIALTEMGVSVTAYLASASVIGLAVGFGSQGVVQDAVTGLTLVFSDLFDVGELVEISGQSGIVRGIGMRFTELENAMGASVFIPNRTITNVIRYQKGYVRCLVDVTLPEALDADAVVEEIKAAVTASTEQFPGLFIHPPSIEGIRKTSSGRRYLRLKFRIWPGRGAALETGLRQEITALVRRYVDDYADWMVSVTYEVES